MSRARIFMKPVLFASLPVLLCVSLAYAHRSECHRWHSCPADKDAYVCGDLGVCSQCPDNQYCKEGQPRLSTSTPPPSYSHGRSDVREVQRLLNLLGYNAGAVDGIYGSQTRQAIQNFNQDSGYSEARPIVDEQLLTHLRARVELMELKRR